MLRKLIMSKNALRAARPDFLSAILQFTYLPSNSIVYFSSHFHANYVRFDGFHRNISYNFLKLMKSVTYVFAQKKCSRKTFFVPKFTFDTIN